MKDQEIRRRQGTDVGAQYPINSFTKGRDPQKAEAAEPETVLLTPLKTRQADAHVENVGKALLKLADHLRSDIDKMDEPRAQALFKTSAEILEGLATAFAHYMEKNEPSWR